MASSLSLLPACALALLASFAPVAAASPVTLTPGAGTAAFGFMFGADAALAEVYDTTFDSQLGTGGWTITLAQTAYLNAVAEDGFVPGDAFELLINGSVVAWTHAGAPMDWFRGELVDHELAAGTHEITLRTTRFANGFEGGGAYASFAVTPSQAVPLPATLPLATLALAGLALLSRRRGA